MVVMRLDCRLLHGSGFIAALFHAEEILRKSIFLMQFLVLYSKQCFHFIVLFSFRRYLCCVIFVQFAFFDIGSWVTKCILATVKIISRNTKLIITRLSLKNLMSLMLDCKNICSSLVIVLMGVIYLAKKISSRQWSNQLVDL